ncbi:MAG: outer membrane protein assembly factor BamD [Myxococcota bacterium]
MRWLLLAVLAAALSLTSACVPMQKGQQMEEEIEALKSQQTVMAEKYKEQEEQLTQMIASAREDVDEMRSVLKEAKELLQRNSADLGAEMQENRAEIQQLRGKIEEMEFKIQKLEQELELFKEDVDIRFASGEAVAAQLPEEAVPLYEFGKEKLEAESTRAARKAFEEFLSRFTGHPKAAEVQFLLGETYHREEHWVSAISEYQKILNSRSDSTYVDDATFRIGEGFYELGRCENAKVFFETIVEDYGSSTWASDARTKLNDIKSGKCGN